jgi:hypothetical protein
MIKNPRNCPRFLTQLRRSLARSYADGLLTPRHIQLWNHMRDSQEEYGMALAARMGYK